MIRRLATLVVLVAVSSPAAAPEDGFVSPGVTGKPGGKLVYSQRAEPKTLNPVLFADAASREVIHRMTADLIHINRATQKTEPALAKSWTVSPNGLRYVLELRRGVRFSDGHPFDADDVVFSFQVYLDEKTGSPQRDLLLLDGKPITVRKLGPITVAFELPQPYAAAERLFDGFAILPRHLLEGAWREGKLAGKWGLRSPPAEIAGLGPFRLKELRPRASACFSNAIPIIGSSTKPGTASRISRKSQFTFAGSEDMQTLRFQSGESDIVSRVGAKNFAICKRTSRAAATISGRSALAWNTASCSSTRPDPAQKPLTQIAARQRYFSRRAFRQAVSLAIDRDAHCAPGISGLRRAAGRTCPPGQQGLGQRRASPDRPLRPARARTAGRRWL